MTAGVESEGNPPDAGVGPEAKFLHVGVARSVQRIHPGPAKLRAVGFKQTRVSERFILHDLAQLVELRLKLVA